MFINIGSVHNRLYDHGKKHQSRERVANMPKEDCTFQPALNKNTKNFVRIGKIEDRLMQDAKKRTSAKACRATIHKLGIRK